MSAPKWYFSRDGVEKGPLSSSELRAMAKAGQLLESDLLWKEGMKKWRPAGEAGRLFGADEEEDARPGRRRKRRSPDGASPAAGAGRSPRLEPGRDEDQPSTFRVWALSVGCPGWLLEPIPVAGGVAAFFVAIWLIVWVLMLTSPETDEMVKDVKRIVIAEAGEAVTQATEAATRTLVGDQAGDEDATSPPAKPKPSGPARSPAEPADLGGADF